MQAIEIHKSQDNYDYYQNVNQNLNVNHHHMGGTFSIENNYM